MAQDALEHIPLGRDGDLHLSFEIVEHLVRQRAVFTANRFSDSPPVGEQYPEHVPVPKHVPQTGRDVQRAEPNAKAGLS